MTLFPKAPKTTETPIGYPFSETVAIKTFKRPLTTSQRKLKSFLLVTPSFEPIQRIHALNCEPVDVSENPQLKHFSFIALTRCNINKSFVPPKIFTYLTRKSRHEASVFVSLENETGGLWLPSFSLELSRRGKLRPSCL